MFFETDMAGYEFKGKRNIAKEDEWSKRTSYPCTSPPTRCRGLQWICAEGVWFNGGVGTVGVCIAIGIGVDGGGGRLAVWWCCLSTSGHAIKGTGTAT
jgi:hypothetical protein